MSAARDASVGPVAEVLARGRHGAVLADVEIETLLRAQGAELDALCSAAAAIRDRGLEQLGRPRTITYSRKVFIPLTRLCRDRCHYCTFATTPNRVPAAFLELDEVLEIARAGAELGCKEALFTLGDRPEDRWPQARQWLAARGYDSTLDYVAAAARAVLEQTGLLPHLNPGVMSREEMRRLRPVAPSMGMMLETTSDRLFTDVGQVHFASPDKEPRIRLQVLRDAGALDIPFTTGILVGIGESVAERADSIGRLRDIAAEFPAIQEIIVQNFRAKSDTAMRNEPDLDLETYVAAIATTRVVLGDRIRIQAPPNLVDLDECVRLIGAGIDDWGGVSPLTPDHVNPERPWPNVEALRDISAKAGLILTERLTAHSPYVLDASRWIDDALHSAVAALADESGLAAGASQGVAGPVGSSVLSSPAR